MCECYTAGVQPNVYVEPFSYVQNVIYACLAVLLLFLLTELYLSTVNVHGKFFVCFRDFVQFNI